MKHFKTVLALTALGVLAGCENAQDAKADRSSSASASPVSDDASAGDAAAGATGPVLKAASYPPRDDCASLPGWSEFSEALKTAVARRDADALAALSDSDVVLDFGGGAGVAELRRRLDDPDYLLWDEIAAILTLGCGQQYGGAAMPWIFANTPADADAYDGMLVLGSAVPAYARADRSAPVKAVLNWPLVKVSAYNGKDAPFTEVILPQNAGTAHVETARLRSLIDYRLIAERGQKGWRITALIAGD